MGQSRLDPFGSGTFFIRLGNILFRKLKRLNPFGSGTFFIRYKATGKSRSVVLIPLVQGRFLFAIFDDARYLRLS